MKSIKVMQQISILLVCLSILSCSNDLEETSQKTTEEQESYVSATLGTESLPSNLQCDLYIFWKSTDEVEYSFKEKVTLAGTQSSMRFKNNDLINKDYRFLFIATSADTPEISVTNSDNNILNTDNKWHNLLISANEMLLSTDNYSGILDKTGDEILNGESIDGILIHIVGQIVLDIFRINENINAPMDIVSQNIASVLDRVFKVEVEYEGMTKSVAFGISENIEHKVVRNDKYSSTHSITVDNDLKVFVPQVNNGLEVSPVDKIGSVRIKGLYCLPSTENMRIKFTFHYYDTTPMCGSSDGHTHSSDCFDKRTLVLNLPQDVSGTTLLSVFPNYYTVNKAGIRYDRIIDLKMESSILFETEWSR